MLNQNKLRESFSFFMENEENYPKTISQTADYWASAIRNYLLEGEPKNTAITSASEKFRVEILNLFLSYPKTIREFTDKLENLVYQLHIEILPGFTPNFTPTPKLISKKPNFFPIFNSRTRINLPERLSHEIHLLFFDIKLVNNQTGANLSFI